MNQQERPNPDIQPVIDAGPPAGPGGTDLNTIRQAATGMLDAADEAINAVLSGDSQAFNAAMHQQSGQ